jgi:hypothetical protein
MMDTHTIENIDDARELLRQYENQLGYVQLDRESPRPAKLGKFEWNVDKARDRGLLENTSTEDDLIDGSLAWVESLICSDVAVGEKIKYRFRLAAPKGEWLRQCMLTALPCEAPAHPLDAVIATSSPQEGAALAMTRAILDEQRRGYRDIISHLQTLLQMSMREARESRMNVNALFEAHIGRELAMVEKAKQEAQAAKEEAQAAKEEAENGGLIDGITKMGLQLWAVQNDLPPELVETVAKDDELRAVLSKPGLVKQLNDPAIRDMLRQLAEAAP